MRTKVPKYRRHPETNLAYVECKELFPDKRRHYIGRWKSKESRAEYADILTRLAQLRSHEPKQKAQAIKGKITVARLMADFLADRIELKGGDDSEASVRQFMSVQNIVCIAELPQPVKRARTLDQLRCEDFDQSCFHKMRETMAAEGWCRNYINQQAKKFRRMIRWGVDRGLISWEAFGRLQSIKALKRGDIRCKETAKVRETTRAAIDAVLPFLSCPMLRAMYEIHYLCGLRSEDVCDMRGEQLDRSGDVWFYIRDEHKTDRTELERVIKIGPKAQKLLAPYIVEDGYLFTPRIAERERREQGRRRQAERRERDQECKIITSKPRDRKNLRAKYDSTSYRKALLHAYVALAKSKDSTAEWSFKRGGKSKSNPAFRLWLKRYGITYWFPHQLRHTRATEIEAAFGIEAAQAVLGNKITAALIYAHNSANLAHKVAKEIG